jgi:hypothetical protein
MFPSAIVFVAEAAAELDWTHVHARQGPVIRPREGRSRHLRAGLEAILLQKVRIVSRWIHRALRHRHWQHQYQTPEIVRSQTGLGPPAPPSHSTELFPALAIATNSCACEDPHKLELR